MIRCKKTVQSNVLIGGKKKQFLRTVPVIRSEFVTYNRQSKKKINDLLYRN